MPISSRVAQDVALDARLADPEAEPRHAASAVRDLEAATSSLRPVDRQLSEDAGQTDVGHARVPNHPGQRWNTLGPDGTLITYAGNENQHNRGPS